MISYLGWDTEFFGFRVGQVFDSQMGDMELADLERLISQQQYRLVYVMVPDMQLAERQQQTLAFHQKMQQAGLRPVDQKIVYEKEVNNCLKKSRHSQVSAETRIPVSEKLQSLALIAGQHSRFSHDPRFPRHLFTRLYIEWLLKSLTGELASEVLVWLDEFRVIQGFITIQHRQNVSVIGLIAVDESSRGKQVGKTLLQAAEASTARTGNQYLQVATQLHNQAACSFYENYGFALKTQTTIYHWWQ